MNSSLSQEISRAEEAVRRNVRVPLTQNQFDALVSLTYNAGGGNQRDHNGAQPVFQALNQDGAEAAAQAILVTAITIPVRRNGRVVGHRRSQGVINRRHLEVQLFNGQWRGN